MIWPPPSTSNSPPESSLADPLPRPRKYATGGSPQAWGGIRNGADMYKLRTLATRVSETRVSPSTSHLGTSRWRVVLLGDLRLRAHRTESPKAGMRTKSPRSVPRRRTVRSWSQRPMLGNLNARRCFSVVKHLWRPRNEQQQNPSTTSTHSTFDHSVRGREDLQDRRRARVNADRNRREHHRL